MTDATDGATYTCPACGWPGLERPPRPASYEICPSCGFEFGVTDDDEGETYQSWREKWLAQGAPWYSAGTPAPQGWDPQAQVAALDAE
ncbi:MAG: hypothetical protein ACTHQ3_06750 [Motilibacteraceae bacterium]